MSSIFNIINLYQIKERHHPIFIFFAVISTIALMMQKETLVVVLNDFKNKKFLICLALIVIFSYFVFKSESTTKKEKDFKEATRKALAALIIAYLAHLDMIFVPFLVVFLLDYFLSGWV